MTVLYAAPLGSPKFRAFTAAGAPLAGGKVQTYLAGTTTPVASYPTYADAIASTNPNANPVILDANGEALIFLQQLTTLYKIVLSDSANVVQWTVDSYTPATGAVSQDEWITETNPITRVSNTQFKVTGVDVTQFYHAGRRVRLTTARTFGTVTASSYSTDTTVTVVMDAGASVPGTLTGAAYGLLSYGSPFAPSYLDPRTAFSAIKSGTQTGFTAATQVTTWTVELDTLSEWSAGNNRWTALYPGKYLVMVSCEVATTGAITMTTAIKKNGTTNVGSVADSIGASAFATKTAQHVVSLAAGDYLELWVTGDVNTIVEAGIATAFSVVRIA